MMNPANSRRSLSIFFALAFVLVLFCACQTGKNPHAPTAEDLTPPLLRLAPGDVVEVTFPGATNFNAMHRIGPEGTITMPLVGQVDAAGKSAEELQSQLMKLYSTELKDTNVIVSVAGSGNVVYVDGAVLRPMKITLERPITALEAVEEAGGFTDTANRKKVTVIRYKGNENTVIELNLTFVHVTSFTSRRRFSGSRKFRPIAPGVLSETPALFLQSLTVAARAKRPSYLLYIGLQ
jgi:polysaccharide export outer membrane protein